MADFEMTPGELRDAATFFSAKSEDMKSIINTLTQEVDNLDAGWDGAAQDAFFASYNEYKEPMNQFPQLLDQIAEQLKMLAENFEGLDSDLAQQMK